jgi:hypothetical protein
MYSGTQGPQYWLCHLHWVLLQFFLQYSVPIWWSLHEQGNFAYDASTEEVVTSQQIISCWPLNFHLPWEYMWFKHLPQNIFQDPLRVNCCHVLLEPQSSKVMAVLCQLCDCSVPCQCCDLMLQVLHCLHHLCEVGSVMLKDATAQQELSFLLCRSHWWSWWGFYFVQNLCLLV